MNRKMGRSYLIKNGSILSIETGELIRKDILIERGLILAVEEELWPEPGTEVINAKDMLITPGWLDAHAHVYQGSGTIGVATDSMAEGGVTFVADAGTAGACNFEDLRERFMGRSLIRVKAYLNIAKWGISTSHGELQNLDNIDFTACEEMCGRYPDEIVGLKARIDPRVCSDGEVTLKSLRELGDRCKKPVVVHASRSGLPMAEILSYLKANDIFAHSYANQLPGLLSTDGTVKQEVQDARNRGVIFDLSHGSSNFSFEVARKAIEQDFVVDMISTDLHRGSNARVIDMASTMTKMLHLGLSLPEVIKRVTLFPARILAVGECAGPLVPGSPADLTVFRLTDGRFLMSDSDGSSEWVSRKIESVYTFLGDRMFFHNSVPN